MTIPESVKSETIAIVMTDIIGSTKFVQKHGAQKAAIWFSQHDRLTMSLIYEHKGVFIDASDGMLCYFNSVTDAVAFSFEYKRSLLKHKFPFKSRLGIHWDDMIITKTSQKLVKGGAKRMNIEGIGKNICARTMSLCGPDQILMSQKAYLSFKSRISNNRFIPKDALVVLVGLYAFKGVKNPEQIYALGTRESHIQPPPDSEKAKRLGGSKKIKTRLAQKKAIEIIEYFFWRLGTIWTLIFIYYAWPFLRYYDLINDIHLFFQDIFLYLYKFLLLVKKHKIG